VVAVEVVAADVVVVYEVVSCVRVEVDDLMMVGSKATGDKEVACISYSMISLTSHEFLSSM